MSVRAVAIICARNEELRIRSALAGLIGEGLEVVLIDHDSTDGTVAIGREFLGRGLLGIERLPWRGRFSLVEQLEAKSQVIDQLDHDWIVHVDADEWLSAPEEGQTLLDGLSAADSAGYNCVNFSEFVFIPKPGEDASLVDYPRALTRYYFYEPENPFLLRAWKNGAGLENRQHAGHRLSGPARPYPRDFPMRHYICLSQAHAEEKYLTRRFDDSEVARGWHRDRLLATKESLRFPSDDFRLRTLPYWASKHFDRSCPVKSHFWEWGSDGESVLSPAAAAVKTSISLAARRLAQVAHRDRRPGFEGGLSDSLATTIFDRDSAAGLRALRADMYRCIARLEELEQGRADEREMAGLPVPKTQPAPQPATADERAEWARAQSLERLRRLCGQAGRQISEARRALAAFDRVYDASRGVSEER